MLFNQRATEVVRSRPTCDHPNCEELAAVDAATNRGPWGYFCTAHHAALCANRLGLGAGQVLLCGDGLDEELKEYYELEDN